MTRSPSLAERNIGISSIRPGQLRNHVQRKLPSSQCQFCPKEISRCPDQCIINQRLRMVISPHIHVSYAIFILHVPGIPMTSLLTLTAGRRSISATSQFTTDRSQNLWRLRRIRPVELPRDAVLRLGTHLPRHGQRAANSIRPDPCQLPTRSK